MANYPEYEYDGSDSELYQTNLYTGTDADLDNTAPVDATDGYTSDIDLTQKTGCVIDFKFDSSGTTDNLVLKLYRRRDSSWDGDEIAIDSITVTSDGTEDIFSYMINESHGPGHYRFSMQSSGATDTFDIDVQCRYYRYEIATA
ncbi:MAG: hypothetical protein SVV88_11010 [Pseudomonadota bacterium]|nr:hypothetical protein [Pseudomonadota bacterium]